MMLKFLTLMKYNIPALRYCHYSCDLHYYYTRNIFVAMFTLSVTRQLFGDNIACENNVLKNIADISCFINGTFTYLNYSYYKTNPNLNKYYHFYYQWIPLVLLLESLAFSIPNWIWEIAVGPYVKRLSIPDSKLDEKYCMIIVSEVRNSKFHFYLKHFILDLTYLGNVLLQMYLLDMFFNNDYINVFRLKLTLPSSHLFPLYVRCNFDWFAVTDHNYYKLRCILPLNILYSKIFLFMWFWLHFLCCFQALVIVMRLFELTCCNVNTWFFYRVVKHNIMGENYWQISSHFEK